MLATKTLIIPIWFDRIISSAMLVCSVQLNSLSHYLTHTTTANLFAPANEEVIRVSHTFEASTLADENGVLRLSGCSSDVTCRWSESIDRFLVIKKSARQVAKRNDKDRANDR